MHSHIHTRHLRRLKKKKRAMSLLDLDRIQLYKKVLFDLMRASSVRSDDHAGPTPKTLILEKHTYFRGMLHTHTHLRPTLPAAPTTTLCVY